MLPPKVRELVQLFARLPSVGDKTAQRFVLHLLTREPDTARALGSALCDIAGTVVSCERCGNLAERDAARPGPTLCGICRDTRRDPASLCVVARIQDLLSIERSSAFQGYYFVLGKLLSPLEGVGADALPLEELRQRVRGTEERPPVTEVLVATPPSVDGEATALLVAQALRPLGAHITRIASGVPHGGDIEFADPVTIGRAIAGRRGLE
jgi:recombination protein RecR